MNNNHEVQKLFEVPVADFTISNQSPMVLIAGPCVLESAEHAHFMASELKEITESLGLNFIFKSSFDKANRTSGSSDRGVGMERGLQILADIRAKYNIPVITDVHQPHQCAVAAEYVDVLQIPAFLCRQTDLITAAAQTGKPVNIKKGQFLSPLEMHNVVDKFVACGNHKLLLCERGTFFGYNNLVVDFTGLPIMAQTGYPVIFDGTHSVQQPGGLGWCTGGRREMVPYLSKAAVAVGVAGLFLEVHDDPDHAPSDGPNMLRLDSLKPLLEHLIKLDNLAKQP